MGLICGLRIGLGNTCLAYPIVQQDGAILLRGWNFWDQHEAALRLASIDRPSGGGIANIVSVAPNEGIAPFVPPIDPCSRATGQNLTHNTASFPLTVPSGFYRLTMFNHNGHYYTQGDALVADTDPAGRTIHVCWPESTPAVEFEPVEATDGTVRGCVQPTSVCEEDGPRCVSVWSTGVPRPLSACQHAVGTSPVCGETPEWFASEPMWTTDTGAPLRYDPIVYVRRSPPLMTVRASLQQIECLGESGSDWAGSDDLLMLIAGSSDPSLETPAADALDDMSNTFSGEFDTGTFRSFPREDPRVLSVLHNVTAGAFVSHMIYLADDDDTLVAQIIGSLVILAVAVVVVILAGATIASVLAGAAAAAVLVIVWNLVLSEMVSPNDVLGFNTVAGSLADYGDRIAATHFPDFLATPPLIGALANLEGGPQQGRLQASLQHPFQLDSHLVRPHEVECTGSGICNDRGVTGVCYVNQCITTPGFTGVASDPTFNRGFRERRDIDNRSAPYGMDARYVLEILWERVPEGS